MTDRLEELKKRIGGDLAASAASYLGPALARFHREPEPLDPEAQAIVGNLCVAVELLLKAFLGYANPALLFKDMPPEARAFLYAPDDVPDGFNWRPFELDLRDFAYDTVGTEDAVKAFYVFFPEKKQLLRPYFKLSAELRKHALHSSMGAVRADELQKTVYLAVTLAQALAARRRGAGYVPDDKDRRYLAAFEAARSRHVRERIAAARQKAAGLKVDIEYNDPGLREGWEALDTRCPVCKNWGALGGVTDIRCEAKDGDEHESLEFRADSFACDACGLLLEDVEELKLADMATEYDRSEDLERWREETR